MIWKIQEDFISLVMDLKTSFVSEEGGGISFWPVGPSFDLLVE